MRSGPTIKDIAREVGVTPATVSYVLSQNPRQTISPQTCQRVLDAAEKMGYVPNSVAKALRNGTSHCIGVAIEKNLVVGRFNQVLQGIRDCLEPAGYNLMLCSAGTRGGLYPDYISHVLEKRTDGVIFIGSENVGPTPQEEELIARHQIPFVLYDCGYSKRPYSTVDLAYRQAGASLAGRLIRNSACRLLYVRPLADNFQEQQRELGVRQAVRNTPGCQLEVLHADIPRLTVDDRLEGESLWRFLRYQVLSSLQHYTSEDAVLFSWGIFAGLFWEIANGARTLPRIGALSDVEVPFILRNRALCCHFPGKQAGNTCARLLLARLSGNTKAYAEWILMPETAYVAW